MNERIKAGADIHAGDGGYNESTQEKYDAFVKIRNKSFTQGRIRELALQAGLVQGGWANADQVKIWKEDPDNPGSLEKFAELIVRECVKEMEEFVIPTEEFTQWNKAINHLSKYLKQHFGVEE